LQDKNDYTVLRSGNMGLKVKNEAKMGKKYSTKIVKMR
jgi:hypothetical protein